MASCMHISIISGDHYWLNCKCSTNLFTLLREIGTQIVIYISLKKWLPYLKEWFSLDGEWHTILTGDLSTPILISTSETSAFTVCLDASIHSTSSGFWYRDLVSEDCTHKINCGNFTHWLFTYFLLSHFQIYKKNSFEFFVGFYFAPTVQRLYGNFPAFTGGGRPQVSLHALFQAWGGTWVEPS